MLNNSNARFLDKDSRVVIEYLTKNLDKDILERLYEAKDTRLDIKLDPKRLLLVNRYDRYRIALLYKVDPIDQNLGWLLVQMYLVTEDFGFILTPMIKWYRDRIVEIYNSIKCNKYKAYLDLINLNNGKVSLVIDYNL